MLKEYIFNKWQYDIIKNEGEGIKGYGFTLYIYKNDNIVFKTGSFGSESMAEWCFKRYMIEHEFNIELD